MKRILTVVIFSLLSSLSPAQESGDDLILNGLAVFEQLRHEYYLGALYLPVPAKIPDNAIYMPGPKRMDIRIISDEWSPRRFARQWNQLISINNAPEQQQAHADDIIAFTNLPKSDLKAGDQLVIEVDPEAGTRVNLNGTTLLQTENEELFNLLLNCWVGPRPPSSSFKQNILNRADGNEASQLFALYDTTIPSNGRRQEISGWLESASDATTTKRRDPAPEEVVPEKPPKAKKSAAELEKERREREAAERAKQAAAEQARQAAIQKALKEAEAKARAKARRQKMISDYSSKMVLASYRHVRYPKRSLKLNQEGTVMLEVVLDRGGDLVSVGVLQSSSFPALDDAAVRAVKRTAPFPTMPDEINGSEIKFTLPFTFQISG